MLMEQFLMQLFEVLPRSLHQFHEQVVCGRPRRLTLALGEVPVAGIWQSEQEIKHLLDKTVNSSVQANQGNLS